MRSDNTGNGCDIIDIAWHLRHYSAYTLIHDREKSRVCSIAAFSSLKTSLPSDEVLYLVENEQLDEALEYSSEHFLNVISFAEIQMPLMSSERYRNVNLLLVHGAEVKQDNVMQTVLSAVVGKLSKPSPYEILLNALSASSTTSLARTIKQIMGNPVFIRDTSLELVGTSVPNHKVTSQNFREQVFYSATMIEKLRSITKPCYYDDGEYVPCILSPVFIDGILAAYMFIPAHYSEFGPHDLEYAAIAAQAVAVEMQKNFIFRFQSGNSYDYFLIRLLESAPGSEMYLNGNLNNIPIKLEGPYCLAVFEMPEVLQSTQFIIKSVSRDIQHILNASLCAYHDSRVIMLICRSSKEILTDEQYHELDQYLSEKGIQCSFSRVYTQLNMTSVYHRQALDILSIKARLKSTKNILTFEEMLPFMMLVSFEERHTLNDCIAPKVVTLILEDREKGLGYFDTLCAYIRNCMQIKKTATELHVHRNTVQYRIERIRERYNIDTENINDVFSIILAEKVIRLEPNIL